MDCFRLRLAAPLYYVPFTGLEAARRSFPFLTTGRGHAEEALFCFELPEDQALSIEPAADLYLGALAAAGTASAGAVPAGTEAGLTLPAGGYWFCQTRRQLSGAEYAALAIELQKEGLWQREKLGTRLYFRTLREDGADVFQAFRPLRAEGFTA